MDPLLATQRVGPRRAGGNFLKNCMFSEINRNNLHHSTHSLSLHAAKLINAKMFIMYLLVALYYVALAFHRGISTFVAFILYKAIYDAIVLKTVDLHVGGWCIWLEWEKFTKYSFCPTGCGSLESKWNGRIS